MQENGKFYIALNGVKYEVSKEVREAFYQAERKKYMAEKDQAHNVFLLHIAGVAVSDSILPMADLQTPRHGPISDSTSAAFPAGWDSLDNGDPGDPLLRLDRRPRESSPCSVMEHSCRGLFLLVLFPVLHRNDLPASLLTLRKILNFCFYWEEVSTIVETLEDLRQ